MTSRSKYTVLQDGPSSFIVKSLEETDLSWREAKKRLRQRYLDEAKRLRTVSEDTYYNK